jgi:hypothetical protein
MSVRFDETRAHLDGFNAYYRREIAGELEALERQRKSALWKAAIALLLSLPIAITGVIYAWPGSDGTVSVELVISVLVGLAGIGFAFFVIGNVKQDVKAHLVGKVCGFFGLRHVAQPSGYPLAWFRELRLVPDYDRSRLEDNITGAHEGVAIDIAEAKLEERHTDTDSKGRQTTHYVTVFRGLLCMFSFPKRFQGRTVIARDPSILTKWLQSWSVSGDRVRLEDPRFEDAFEVYGSDQVEARYLLTPTFMERILDLDRRFGGGRLQLAFDEDRLMISIRQSRDRFEAGSIFSAVTDPRRITDLLAEIALIFEIIDILNLQLRTRA